MKTTILLVYLYIISFSSKGQERDSLFYTIELGGANTIYSINFEKKIKNYTYSYFYAKTGFCLLNSNNIGMNASIQFVKKTNRKWCRQLGFGVAINKNYLLEKSISFQSLLGIRRKIKNNYLLLAINPSLHYFPDSDYKISCQFLFPSISYGVRIKPNHK